MSENLPQLNNDQIIQKELESVKDQIMPGSSTQEIQLFAKYCAKTKLDPFTRQIYAIKRRSKSGNGWREFWTYQTSIDGFRVVAERSGFYEGQTPGYWCGKDGVWKDVWLSDTPPCAAKIGVYRKGHREPIWSVAKFDSYKQEAYGKLSSLWQKMPEVMILKCAEALALRKAFPNDLSGLYTAEEMSQSEKSNENHATNNKKNKAIEQNNHNHVSEKTEKEFNEDRRLNKIDQLMHLIETLDLDKKFIDDMLLRVGANKIANMDENHLDIAIEHLTAKLEN